MNNKLSSLNSEGNSTLIIFLSANFTLKPLSNIVDESIEVSIVVCSYRGRSGVDCVRCQDISTGT